VAKVDQQAIHPDLHGRRATDNAIVFANTQYIRVNAGGSMRLAMIMLLAGTLMASVGCAGDDVAADSPAGKCKAIGVALCSRDVACIDGDDDLQQTCLDALDNNASCRSAKSIEDTFDTCLDTINHATCQALLATDPGTDAVGPIVPRECVGVIDYGVASRPRATTIAQ
jgi:hypothetical protein